MIARHKRRRFARVKPDRAVDGAVTLKRVGYDAVVEVQPAAQEGSLEHEATVLAIAQPLTWEHVVELSKLLSEFKGALVAEVLSGDAKIRISEAPQSDAVGPAE